MKYVHFHRRPISIFVMLTFVALLCLWANASPAAQPASASAKGQAASAANDEEGSPGVFEEESSQPAAKHGKKVPWLLIGAAVAVGAVVVYFLVAKKTKHTLTVSLSGATGTPAATADYKKNSLVRYDYTALSGYLNLEVKLDGTVVPAAGTVKMDKDHSLTAIAVQGSVISVNSTPGGARIFLNNSDSGFTTPHVFQHNTAVTQTVMLRLCGYQDYSRSVTANLGQTVTVDYNLSPGILDNFDMPSACWVPHTAADTTWKASGGIYQCVTSVKAWGYVSYDKAFSSSYTAEVKMRRVKGSRYNSTSIILSTGTDIKAIQGYLFNYTVDGWYSIWKLLDEKLTDVRGIAVPIKQWGPNHNIVQNLGSWNTLKVVRSGSNYTFFINGKGVYGFSDDKFDARVFNLAFFCGGVTTEMQYDYVKLDEGATLGSLPPEAPVFIQDPRQKPTGRL